MNIFENRQRVKNEALNKIRKIYNPDHRVTYDEYDLKSLSEQREIMIESIISNLETEMKEMSNAIL